MAIDVFLIVYYKYDAEALRKLELKYICVITAFVFIPAFTFLFIHTPEKGHMYGSVTVSPIPQLQISAVNTNIRPFTALVLNLSPLGALPHSFLLWPHMVRLVLLNTSHP